MLLSVDVQTFDSIMKPEYVKKKKKKCLKRGNVNPGSMEAKSRVNVNRLTSWQKIYRTASTTPIE